MQVSNGGEEYLPSCLEELAGKEFVFQIRVTPFNFTPNHRTFTVSTITRVAYACVSDDVKNFYYKRLDKSSSEKDAFDYVMKYVNSFSDRNNETIFIVSNNKKIIGIIDKLEDTENISYIGKYDSEEARDVFMKLQVAISMREK